MKSRVVETINGPMLVFNNDLAQTGPLAERGRPSDHEDIERARAAVMARGLSGAFMDIGACLGTWTIAMAGTRLITEIHTFEPQRMLAHCIAGSAALNGLNHARIHNKAAGDKCGLIAMPHFDYSQPNNYGSIEFSGQQTEQLAQPRLPDTGEMIEMVAIDTIRTRDRVILMKIDVEGMERAVLQGARRTIMRDRPILNIEFIKCDKAGLLSDIYAMQYVATEHFSDFLCTPI